MVSSVFTETASKGLWTLNFFYDDIRQNLLMGKVLNIKKKCKTLKFLWNHILLNISDQQSDNLVLNFIKPISRVDFLLHVPFGTIIFDHCLQDFRSSIVFHKIWFFAFHEDDLFAKKHWPLYCLYFVHFHTCSIIFQYVLCNDSVRLSRKENSKKVCTGQSHISIPGAPFGAQSKTSNVHVPVPPHPRSKIFYGNII